MTMKRWDNPNALSKRGRFSSAFSSNLIRTVQTSFQSTVLEMYVSDSTCAWCYLTSHCFDWFSLQRSFLPWSQKTKKALWFFFFLLRAMSITSFFHVWKYCRKRFKHCRFSWPNPDLEVSRKTTALPSSRVICHIEDLFLLLRITRENGATAKSHWCSAWLQCSPFVTPLLPLCCPIVFSIFLWSPGSLWVHSWQAHLWE